MINQSSLSVPPVTASDPHTSDPAVAGPISRADQFMRWLLRIPATNRQAARGAHRMFRISVVFTALRCFVTYVAIPLLVPVVSFAGLVAVPISIALCVFALANGVFSVRRFWLADHRSKWAYTGFMAVVFAVLAVSLAVDISALGGS